MKPRRRAGVRVLRRASTQRRSQRSVGRSGYAFSHEEGFGELITSGSLMVRRHPFRPSIGKVVAPATAGSVSALPPPPPSYTDCLDDSGIPSVTDASTVTASDLITEGVPLTPVEETPPEDTDPKPRNPVVV